MDTKKTVEFAQSERMRGCELRADGKLDEALFHFRNSTEVYGGMIELTGEQRREYVGALYDATETLQMLRNVKEASTMLRQAWLMSDTALASRGRGMAVEILEAEPSTHFLGGVSQPLRTTATYILGALDIGRPANNYAFRKSALSTQTAVAGANQRSGLSTWGVIQLIILAIILLFRLASCQ